MSNNQASLSHIAAMIALARIQGTRYDCNLMLESAARMLEQYPDHIADSEPSASTAKPVTWAIFDSQGFYETRDTEKQAERFCEHYNSRSPSDPLRPYTYAPLFRSTAFAPVGHFLNDAADGAPPHYAQVAGEYIGTPGVTPLFKLYKDAE